MKMAKKIITLLLFLLMLALAFIQYYYIKDSSKDLAALCSNAVDTAKNHNMKMAFTAATALNDAWESQKAFYQALMEHSESDKISIAMQRALSYAHQNDETQFLAEMNTLIFLLQHIHEIDSLSFENIL
jgi:hypothetical protein